MTPRTSLQKLCLICLCLFSFALFTGQASAETPPKTFLWSMSSGQNTLYLLGSLHLLSRDAYPLPAPINNAYEASSKIVFETDVQKLSSFQSQAKMMLRGLLPEGQRLEQHLSTETYEIFNRYLKGAGHEITSFTRLKPWMCALTLTLMEFNKKGMHTGYGIESYLLQKAVLDGKRVDGLVPVDEHIDILTSMDNDEQETFLRQTLVELEQINELTADMENAWKNGDTEGLAQLMQKSMGESPEMYEMMLTKRNRKWLPIIEGFLAGNEDVLVVVGAGHLVGEESVIDLLQKNGHTLTRY